MTRSLTRRASGLLLHPTSLYNEYPIGDIGPAAYAFIDFLAAAGQSWWQMLPLSPIGLGHSPYKSVSTFAANPLLISPDGLVGSGWLSRTALSGLRSSRQGPVNYDQAQETKDRCFQQAFEQFRSKARAKDREEFERFIFHQRAWLPDFALFVSLQHRFGGKRWWTWDEEIRKRRPSALAGVRKSLAQNVAYHQFVQWQFSLQWEALKKYAARRGIGFIGDLPIFVSEDSADVWAHPELFTLRADGSPALVAGVAPDYFSKTGQLWGNPHYRWDAMKKQGYAWWADRLKTAFRYVDAVRIDHFIGFVRYYAIPGHAKDAVQGRYVKGPGAEFFENVLAKIGKDRCGAMIAEDLGKVTPAVKALREQFGFPGMKVMQFAFGSDPEAFHYQPHNYKPNCVVYTGTHDNNTTVGWFKEEAGMHQGEAEFALRYLNSDGREINKDMIRAAMASPGNTVIIPMQDVLGLGSKYRMNRPGTPSGNWEWRMTPGSLTSKLATWLRELSETYQRIE